MKQLHRQPNNIKQIATKSTIVVAAVLMVVAAPLSLSPVAKADEFDDQMNALQREADQFQAQADKLREEADTLSNKIKQLNAQKSKVQTEIDLSQTRYDQLKLQIKKTEERIEENREALGETVADLYTDSEITPLEMLASSDNVGDFVDKHAYQSSIRDTLTTTIEVIRELREKLEADKKEVKVVLDRQTAQRNSLAAVESEQRGLLKQTEGKESQYKALVAKKKNELESVAAQQRAYYESLLQSSGGGVSGAVGAFQYSNWSGNQGCGGGYSYCGGGLDYTVDEWALYARECVSYVAWALEYRFGKYVAPFNGEGNAYEWPYSAPKYSRAYRVSDPQPGDAVILPQSGNLAPIGHAMIVESVSGSTIHVSQFNFYGTGEYSTMDIQNSGVILLRFQNK